MAPGSDSPPRWMDSHCHIQDHYRSEDVELFSVLSEAAGAGVGGLVCVGTDADTFRQAVELVSGARLAIASGPEATGAAIPAEFGVWATMGLHPHEASHGIGAGYGWQTQGGVHHAPEGSKSPPRVHCAGFDRLDDASRPLTRGRATL